jgi:hypothetical protein
VKRRAFLTLLAATVSERALAQATVVSSCGSVTLTAGTPHNVTIDVNGQSCQSGASGGTPTSTWSATDAAANGMTLSNGGLTLSGTAPGLWRTTRSSISKTSGKLYVEFYVTAETSAQIFGLADVGFSIVASNAYLGSSVYSAGIGTDAGGCPVAGFDAAHYTNTPALAVNDVWALAVDFSVGSIWVAKNNVWSNSSNPATGSLPIVTFTPASVPPLFAAVSFFTGVATVTLQSTAASQKYAPPSGFVAWDGGAAPSHSAEALAYLARTVGGDEGGNGANIATLIDGLVSDGVWAKLDALYVLAQQNQSDAKLNLIGTSYTASGSTLRIAPTFTQYAGFSFPGGSSLNLNFTPSTATSPNYTLNSASYGLWSYAVLSETAVQMGANVSSLYDDYGGSTFYGAINNSGIIGVTTTITKGLFAVDREGAATWYQYQNGAAGSASTSVPTSVDTAPFILAQSGSLQTICAAFIGASLGAAGQLALYNRLRTYMSAIGVP